MIWDKWKMRIRNEIKDEYDKGYGEGLAEGFAETYVSMTKLIREEDKPLVKMVIEDGMKKCFEHGLKKGKVSMREIMLYRLIEQTDMSATDIASLINLPTEIVEESAQTLRNSEWCSQGK